MFFYWKKLLILRRKLMSKFVGENNMYLISRTIDNVESLARIDDFNGTIYWVDDVNAASRFDSIDDAKVIVSMQEKLGQILKRDWKLEVLEEFRSVKNLSSKE